MIAAIYDAASDPGSYGCFVAALSEYLENMAVKAWKIRDLSEIDVGVIEADSGLAMHLANLNRKLAASRDRSPPGSLRERIAQRPGIALLVDPVGRVASFSPAARRFIEDGARFTEKLETLLHAQDAGYLRDAMVEHVLHKRNVTPRILRGDAFHLAVRSVRCAADELDFLCIETLDMNWSPELEAVLEASFRLTPAEMRVVQRLAAGDTAKAISVRFKRSEGTVRNQIKSILAKTDATGIANLIRIVALIAQTVAGAPALNRLQKGTSVDLEILTLPDGRSLEVRQQGPSYGQPVLFIHGMLFGSELPRSALDCLERQGLRLIAPARPNFGMSDPPPGAPEDEADRLVEDLIFVLEHYDVEKTVCLTNIAGSIYGYALASAMPERVTGLVNAASCVPLTTARQFAYMPPTQRLIAFLMRFVPSYLPPLLQSGIAQIRSSGEIPFLATLYGPGTRDHAVTNRADLVDLMARSVHFATDQGYFGAYTDTLQVLRDWSHYAERVSASGIPSIHIHGTVDPQYQFADMVRFADRFETLQVRSVEGSGQLVLYDRPEPIIEAVAELFR
ncbi:MAG: alpha/beta fold hydrolase [Rhodobacteraceae bacterium]|nr:alpha/beta fold hydrolase [Paracoccaceae bacterium]